MLKEFLNKQFGIDDYELVAVDIDDFKPIVFKTNKQIDISDFSNSIECIGISRIDGYPIYKVDEKLLLAEIRKNKLSKI